MLAQIDVILHRPQSSENIGAVARAMKNFGLRQLVLVAPKRYDDDRARVLAVHAGDVLDRAIVTATVEEAVAPYALVIPTTERALAGRSLPLGPRETARALVTAARTARAAILFGTEAHGLPAEVLHRFALYSSIPSSPERRSLNLAQAFLLYAWEIYQESESVPAPKPPAPSPPAPQALVTLLREHARTLLLNAGFLNRQQPDLALDELLRLLQRAEPTKREIEMLLAACAQLQRTSIVAPN